MKFFNLSRRDWLKASAVGILGSVAHGVLPSKIFAAHDAFQKPNLDFSLEEVRLGQSLFVHPRTQKGTTQNERRAMVEMRTHVGLWRVIRESQRMVAESPADVRETIKGLLGKAVKSGYKSMRRYHNTSNIFGSPKAVYTLHGPSSYTWRFPGNGLVFVRRAVELNPTWAERNLNSSLITLLGIKITNGKVEPLDPGRDRSPRAYTDPAGKIGAMKTQMTFRPLTDQMITLLDAVQRSHDAWVQAIKDNAPDAELDSLVQKHHREHSELEYLSRDHDELTLLAFQHHMHDIDRRHSRAEIIKLADRSNAIHSAWVKSVKAREIRGAWLNGLNHSRLHVMLGFAGIELQEIPV